MGLLDYCVDADLMCVSGLFLLFGSWDNTWALGNRKSKEVTLWSANGAARE